jgi:(2Fe-2S) ferredoxin
MRVSHHLLLCATPSRPRCGDPGLGAASWERLKRLVRDLGLEDPARPGGVVWRSKADCLRVCRDGPVLLIWPDGSLYGGVGPERIERILREHVIGGRPVREWLLEQVSLAGAPGPASGP